MKDFKDPTYTPLRDDEGSFKKVPPPPEQIKVDETDPNWENLNPDIIALCQRNGMARSVLNLYLTGQVSWMQSLELMVVALGKELLANQDILVEVRNEYLSVARQVKKLSAVPLLAGDILREEEEKHKQFFLK